MTARATATTMATEVEQLVDQYIAAWNETDPGARANQRIHFLKNVSMAGGLLMATLDPDPHKKFIVRRAKDKVVEAKDKVAEEIDQLRN